MKKSLPPKEDPKKDDRIKPLILVNFKTYPEAVGNKAIALAQQLSLVKSRGYDLAIAPSLLDLQPVLKVSKIKTYAQHADGPLGAHTGSIPVDELHRIGAAGTLLNHSEHKQPFEKIKQTIAWCHKKGLLTIVCTSDIMETQRIAGFRPDYIAYEPPELIGGNISVTSAQPEIIIKALKTVQKISPSTKFLCGAGIQRREDIIGAIKLGASGVLIGHAASQAANPKVFMENMLE